MISKQTTLGEKQTTLGEKQTTLGEKQTTLGDIGVKNKYEIIITSKSEIYKNYSEVGKVVYIQQESNLWLPKEEQEKLEGVVVGVVDGKYGNQHRIKKADKKVVTTPSHKVLMELMMDAEIGDLVKVVYLGVKTATKEGYNDTPLYDVFIDDGKEEKKEKK